MKILVLNAGSSSLKCELYKASEGHLDADPIWEAQGDWKSLPGEATLRVQSAGTPAATRHVQVRSLEHTTERLLRTTVEGELPLLNSFDEIAIAGHRIVHGGDRYRESTPLTADVRQGILDLAPFAPLHNPLALQAIEACDTVLGSKIEQIAVFDTSFHSTLPPESYVYPVPKSLLSRGVRRYGFHGISHQYVSGRAMELVTNTPPPSGDLRMITCHLGNGCSLCALKGGRSVETTMGFTPLEGLMMGSRSGTIDPGLILYLIRHDGRNVDDIDRMLNQDSGLKGLSGISSDMRQVITAADNGDADARLAVDVFVYRLAYFISALLPALGGLDALVFAGGIGENAAEIRRRACDRLRFLGVSLNPEANLQPASDRLISAPDSLVKVMIVRTRENYMIARECVRLLANAKP